MSANLRRTPSDCRQLSQNLNLYASQQSAAYVMWIESCFYQKEGRMDVPRRQMLQIVSFALGSTLTLDRLTAQTATAPTPPPPPAAGSASHGSAGETKMERVMGIGGFF